MRVEALLRWERVTKVFETHVVANDGITTANTTDGHFRAVPGKFRFRFRQLVAILEAEKARQRGERRAAQPAHDRGPAGPGAGDRGAHREREAPPRDGPVVVRVGMTTSTSGPKQRPTALARPPSLRRRTAKRTNRCIFDPCEGLGIKNLNGFVASSYIVFLTQVDLILFVVSKMHNIRQGQASGNIKSPNPHYIISNRVESSRRISL